jgi:hypothetical protein
LRFCNVVVASNLAGFALGPITYRFSESFASVFTKNNADIPKGNTNLNTDYSDKGGISVYCCEPTSEMALRRGKAVSAWDTNG